MDCGIFVGVVLVVGVFKINDGVNISNWNSFMEEVIELFVVVKFQVFCKQIKVYFKYFVNSEKWVEGLGNIGDFFVLILKKVMKKYVLCDYDYEVCNKLLIDFEVEKRVREVVEEVIYVMKEF